MAKSNASFLLTGGGGGGGCGRSPPGTSRQDPPPLRRCPMRCPRALRGAWLSTWRGSRRNSERGEGSLALRTPGGAVYCPRAPVATAAPAAAVLPQVAAAAVAAAAFDMLPGRSRNWHESRVAAIASRRTAPAARRPALDQEKNAALPIPGHSGRCARPLAGAASSQPCEWSQRAAPALPRRGCEGELRRKSLRRRWSRRARPPGVTGHSTYQKPGVPREYSRFAEGSAANQLPGRGGVERVWGGGEWSGVTIGCSTRGGITGVEPEAGDRSRW